MKSFFAIIGVITMSVLTIIGLFWGVDHFPDKTNYENLAEHAEVMYYSSWHDHPYRTDQEVQEDAKAVGAAAVEDAKLEKAFANLVVKVGILALMLFIAISAVVHILKTGHTTNPQPIPTT